MSQAPEPPALSAAFPGDPAPSPPGPYRAATLRALIVAVIISLLVTAWTKQAELVTLTSQISESTPPIASILALFLVLSFSGFMNRLAHRQHSEGRATRVTQWARRLVFSPGEILVVFVFLAITAAMPGVGLFRQVMPCLMVTQYFGNPSNHLEEMAAHIPTQWAPTDPEVARIFWEGGDSMGQDYGLDNIPVIGPALEAVVRFVTGPRLIPWQHWAVPFLLWSGYLLAYFVAAFCLVTLFRRTWEEDEHLNFPISSFAVEMIRPEGSMLSGKDFFRDPVVWIGFSLAVLYNLFNILKVFNPAVPALGISYPLGALFTESPWDTMRGFTIFYKPELIGLGYLVPSDVLFSIWVFTLLSWIVRPFARIAGYEPAGFPFVGQQAMGGFIMLGIYFLYLSRRRLAQAWRKALTGDPSIDDSQEPLSFRLSIIGAVVGLIVVIGMPILFGVGWWVSLMYFGLMVLMLIVYARNRAEMGFPVVWGYPLYQQRAAMVYTLGSQPFVGPGNVKSFTLLSMFSWLQRSVNQAITSTGQEATLSAHRLGYDRRTLAKVVIGALIFGVLTAFLLNLSTFYEYGGLVLSSAGGIEGGQMTQEVLSQFTAVSQWQDKPEPPNNNKIGYTILGMLMVVGMIVGRRVWVRFPFHPGGYALALCHGSPFMFFPAFLLWGVKALVLHVGGVGAYRRIAPGFLAFTLGHFLVTGIWSLAGLYAGEWVRRYVVWFL